MIGWLGLSVGVIGVLLSLYFALRAEFQASDFRDLLKTSRAIIQSIFNALWRMGDNADRALEARSLPEAQAFARGIGDMSHVARNMVISFSQEKIGFTPFYEKASEPSMIQEDEPRGWLREFFGSSLTSEKRLRKPDEK